MREEGIGRITVVYKLNDFKLRTQFVLATVVLRNDNIHCEVLQILESKIISQMVDFGVQERLLFNDRSDSAGSYISSVRFFYWKNLSFPQTQSIKREKAQVFTSTR
jgi:hypothetical protein